MSQQIDDSLNLSRNLYNSNFQIACTHIGLVAHA